VIPLLIIAVAWGAYYWFIHSVHASLGYCLEAKFESFPPNDRELKKWLQAQPGIVPHHVAIGRFDRDKKLLCIAFTQVRNLAGKPPIPDVDAACERLGYVKPDGPFRDCIDQEKSFQAEE
jgi:hypothetical protein